MRRKSLWIVLVLVVVAAGGAYARFAATGERSAPVQIEAVTRQDLEAIVSASGKVEAKRTIDISAETPGKVVSLKVAEGDVVTAGQTLLEIDARNLETSVQNREASLATARSTLEQTSSQVENSRIALRQAQDTLKRQEDMWAAGLIARDVFERTQNDLKMRQTDLKVAEQSVRTQEQRIKQEEANLQSARVDLNKVRIVAPMSGLVTRRNVEEGETAVVGTMNNAGTVLLTIADLSVIETEVEVDETDIPFVKVGQDARVTIDAIPGRVFPGTVSEVGNSPIQATGAATTGRATNFKVVVTIKGEVPNVRPGFTCTAEITTARRPKALAVPIAAMTVRELVVDDEDNIIPMPPPTPGTGGAPAPVVLQTGQLRKEFEGVFVTKDGKVSFVPVRTGIAGEKFFEALDGVKEGDQIVVGPFTSVRNMKDGDAVTPASAASSAAGSN